MHLLNEKELKYSKSSTSKYNKCNPTSYKINTQWCTLHRNKIQIS